MAVGEGGAGRVRATIQQHRQHCRHMKSLCILQLVYINHYRVPGLVGCSNGTYSISYRDSRCRPAADQPGLNE